MGLIKIIKNKKCLKKIVTRLFIILVSFPFVITFILISPWIPIRFIRLFSYRIGHYALNTELLLCAIDENIGKDKKKYINIFYTVHDLPICNSQLHKMWKRVIPIFPWPLLAYQIDQLLGLVWGKHYREHPLKIIFEPSLGAHYSDRLLDRAKNCHIKFTHTEESEGKGWLNKIGMNDHSPFVCLLVRDNSYLKSHLPQIDWSYHDYRDASVENYVEAAKYLADLGYYVIRMGKVVGSAFNNTHPKIIDYANHADKSDFLDIYLSAKCSFFISTSSGLDSVGMIFKKPIMITNLALFDLKSWYYWNLFIPKKIVHQETGKLLTITEIFQEYYLFKTRKELLENWENRGYKLIENTSEEILQITKEMVQRINKTWVDNLESVEFQKYFWMKIPLERRQINYTDISMRVGSAFLRENQSLFITTNNQRNEEVINVK